MEPRFSGEYCHFVQRFTLNALGENPLGMFLMRVTGAFAMLGGRRTKKEIDVPLTFQ